MGELSPGCRVCSAGRLLPRRPIRGLSLVRCSSCGVVCLEPEPTSSTLLAGFEDSYFQGGHADGYQDYVALEAFARRQARRYLRLLGELHPGDRTLLDIGCAAGFLLAEAEAAGWSVAGVEPSPAMAAEARRRIAGPVSAGGLGALPEDHAPVHAVTMLNVLEHLPHPAAVRDRLAQLVRPGGILLIETWDVESIAARLLRRHWHQWSPLVPYYYTRRGLQALFGKYFDEARWTRPAKWISLARGVQIIAPGAARRLGRAGELSLPYFTGDLVVSCWRRIAG